MKLIVLILLSSFLFLACNNDKKEDNKCSKTNLTGSCENDQICDNGECVTIKTCKNEDCNANSECVDNKCKCKAGYIDFEDECIVNLCVDPTPCKDDNKTICKALKEAPFFICECNEGFHLDGDKCITNEGDPCFPNPCKEINKTRCLLDPDDNSKAECHCDADYHEDSNLCCQAFSHNDKGVCTCNENYIENPEDPLECIILCTENSVEGFNGYCEDTSKTCIQGICKDNKCIDFQCPENSECATQNNKAECYCNEGLHMDSNLCCTEHASNVNNECKCDVGYTLTEGKCLPLEDNPCEANPFPCNEELHKNKCIIDDSVNGFHCECNVGYELDNENNTCQLTVVDICPDSLICLNDFCVEAGDRANEQCLTDEDCHEFNSESNSFCEPSSVGGICNNCQTSSDCPANTYCETTWHTCKNECDSDSDCPSGRCNTDLEECLIATCEGDDDCQYGSVCIKTSTDSRGMCKRIPCQETECSEFNQNGTCSDGKTCVYGNCVNSCEPNPCTAIPFKTVCNNNSGVISCSCTTGYTENIAGECEPDSTSDCPAGFTCENGYCTDRNDTGFVCANDNDCGEYTNCSTPMTLPSGKCVGCSVKADCPHIGTGNDAYNPFECLAVGSGYCLLTCNTDSDCNAGMTCSYNASIGSKICGFKSCSTEGDCPTGYVCDGSSLKCERIPCSQ